MCDNGGEGQRSSIPVQKLSCEQCRARKVRCERIYPCTQCVRRNILCKFPRGFKPRQKIQRPILSNKTNLNPKTDDLSAKLNQIRSIIDSIEPSSTSNLNNFSDAFSVSQSDSAVNLKGPWTPEVSPNMQMLSSSPTAAEDNACEPDSEGEESLETHAAQAADLVKQMVSSACMDSTSDITSSLDALKRIIQTKKSRCMKAEAPFQVNLTETLTIDSITMPPLEAAMMSLGMLKEHDSKNYFCLFEFESIGEFIEYLPGCYTKRRCHANLMIVNAGLARVFHDCAFYGLDPQLRKEFEGHTLKCRENLEILIARLPFHTPYSFDLALALSMASAEYMTMSRPRMAWKIAVHSAHVFLSLGLNCRGSFDAEASIATRRQKRLFVLICGMEKSLAFRLGKPSTIRTSDVPIMDDKFFGASHMPLLPFFRKWMAISLLQDEVYDHLCSPRASMQSSQTREAKVRELATDMENLLFRPDAAEVHCLETIRTVAGSTMVDIIAKSERISGLAILTLIYRALPAEPGTGALFSGQCVSTALKALEEHQICVGLLEHAEHNLLDIYVQWALLSAPFVPYIVIFCLTIETSSSLYLSKLESVVDATESVTNASSHAYNLKKQLSIFRLMYDVACKWVEIKNTGFGTRGSEIPNTKMMSLPRQLVEPTLGSSPRSGQSLYSENLRTNTKDLVGNPAMDLSGADRYGLGEWMDQNYQIFQLLDDDAFSFDI